jgi:hypothetical protein
VALNEPLCHGPGGTSTSGGGSNCLSALLNPTRVPLQMLHHTTPLHDPVFL